MAHSSDAPARQAVDRPVPHAPLAEAEVPAPTPSDELDPRAVLGNRAVATLVGDDPPDASDGPVAVQRHPLSPAAHPPQAGVPGRGRDPSRMSPRALLAMQRTMGNRAVASVLSAPRPVVQVPAEPDEVAPDEPGHVDPVAPAPHPAPVAVQRAPTVAVQRGIAEKILPGWMLNLAKRGTSKVKGFASRLKGKGKSLWNEGKAKFKSVAGKFKSGAKSLFKRGRSLARRAKSKARSKVKGWVRKGKGAYRKGLDAAKRLLRSGALTGPLINPAVGLSPDDLVDGVKHAADVVGSIPGGVAGFGEDVGQAVKDGLATDWQCDDTQVVAIAGGVKKAIADNAVKAAKKVLGEDRYQRAADFVQGTVAKLKQVASRVKAKIGQVKAELAAWWTATIAPVKDGLKAVGNAVKKTWKDLKKGLGKGWTKLKSGATKTWKAIKRVVGGAAKKAADGIKNTALSVYNGAKGRIGRLWSKLPSWLKGGLKVVGRGLVAPIAAPFALAYKVGQKVGGYVSRNKGRILAALKRGLDAATRGLATAYNAVKGAIKSAATTVKGWAKTIGAGIRKGLAWAYKKVDGWTGGRITKLRQSLNKAGPKLKGEVCELLGDAAGPCIERFVPDPAGADGAKGFATLTLNREITVPVYGVPVKVAAGSTIKIEREGSGKSSIYTVTLLGEGLIAVSVSAGGGGAAPGTGGSSAGLKVSMPKGLAFEKVTGKTAGLSAHGVNVAGGEDIAPAGGGATPAAPAANGAAPAGAGGGAAAGNGAAPAAGANGAPAPGGGAMAVSAEAGLKGSVAMVYKFDASKDRSTCDGLGGMAGLLGSYGVASALPAPLDSVASSFVTDSFAEQLQSVKVTLAQYGNATFELAGGADAIGNLKATIAAERGVEIETKKEGDDVVQNATLKSGVSGGLAAAFAQGPLAGFGATAGASGTVSLGLTYSQKKDAVTAGFAKATLGASVALTEAQKALMLLPPTAKSAVQAQLASWLPPGQAVTGELSVEAELKVDKLHELGGKIDGYFADPDAVTSDGLWAIVSTHLENNYTQMLTVKGKRTAQDTAGAELNVTSKGKGGDMGGKVGVGMARGIEQEKVLYGPAPV